MADLGRARYVSAGDESVLEAFQLLACTEGILPALESAHALAWVVDASRRGDIPKGSTVLVNLSVAGHQPRVRLRDDVRPRAVRARTA